MFWRFFILICTFALLTSAAFADEALPQKVWLEPSGRVLASPLDDEQPDTLFYDNGQPQYYFGVTNYWVYVRFTPPANFQLRSIYIVIWNPSGNTVPCSLFVHLPGSGTNPGTLLASTAFVPEMGFYWYDVNLPAPYDFTAGQDFMIVAGRATGGGQDPPAGWHVLFDEGTTTNRSKRTGQNGNHMGPYQAVSGDYPIRAGGAFEAFTDISIVQCFNSVQPSGAAAFHVLPGSAVRFKGEVSNPGSATIPLYTVGWSVRGPGGTVVFSDEVVGNTLDPDARVVLQAANTYSPTTVGEYLVTCVANADSDANAENDTTRLRFFVGDMPRWFRYDDNATPESHVNFSSGNGWAVSFTPVSYTAAIESIRVELSVSGAANADFRIYRNDAQGFPGGNPLWQGTPAAVNGWNLVAVNPPVQIYEGQSFTLAYMWTGPALGKDDSPPNCAGIDSMGTVSWQASSDGAQFDADNSGNWAMQVYMAPGLAPPEIATSPDTVNFGAVDTTGNTTSTLDLVIYNTSTGADLSVSQMVINPPLIRSAFTFQPATLNVQAGDSGIVQISFNPSSVRNYSGVITITNNSLNAPTKNVPIRGDGVVPGAAELPESGLPTAFVLAQNYPNPFNPSTLIRFGLPVAANVRLSVFNVLGQEVALLVNGVMPAGVHSRTFDATDLPAGIYFYRLEAGSFSDIRKMILLK